VGFRLGGERVTPPIVNPLDVAFVLSVTAAAWIAPPSALIVGALYYLLSFYLDYRSPKA
jgi:hypothetical protein